ncbi:MAG: hypothetical protein ACREJC_05505, partial [Tepidisphaeraceae bacterium]
MPYAVIDPDGNVRDLVPDVDTAVQVASQFSSIVQVENGPAPQLGLGGELGALNMNQPAHALRMSGLESKSPFRIPDDNVITLEQAHA